eukprot:gb/GECH01005873.1/.p1 GENE.gb/GECH01005873.1/~~gb/GECH01005873.1/.p1  ORF type:complete len:262 (+),score=56.22 gb/GECH01005873.1/:1-786(+)
MSYLSRFGNKSEDIHRPPYSTRYRWFGSNEDFFAMTDEVIQAQESITDQQKMITEMWDNKLFGPPRLLAHASGPGIPLVSFVDLNFVGNRAGMDSFASSWGAKGEYDRVRPVSIIRHLYGDQDMNGLQKPGEGLQPIKGRQWRFYAYTDAHPEYPSGTTCFCYSLLGAIQGVTGSANFSSPFQVVYPAGSSMYEPGATPKQTIASPAYTSLKEIGRDCGESRIWGGVHFRDSIEEPEEPCTEIGLRAAERYLRMVNGVSKY